MIETITKGLEGNFNIEKALNIKWKEIPARFRAVKAPIRVIVDNKTSDQYTILDIKCKNAPGVLYKITKIITCLLYTSPSPRDGLLSRMPSSA